VNDELGFESGGLRAMMTQPKHALVYAELEAEFKTSFIQMTENDEQALDTHKRTYKEEKRRYTIATFALKTFSNDIGNWKQAHSAIQYLRERSVVKKKDDSLDALFNDLIKVYVLDSMTRTMSLLLNKQGEQAVRVHTGAAIACYQFLAKDDAVSKQAIKYTERIIDVCKRIPPVAALKSAFELSLSKMKKPEKLERTDFVQAELPPFMRSVFDELRQKNEELAD